MTTAVAPPVKKELEDYILEVDYKALNETYIPSAFALEFILFIKAVNGAEGEENTSPVIHMDMLDQLVIEWENLFVAFRGSAKTSVIHEYMFLYIAVHGSVPGFGNIDVAIYVSDTIENGIKSMRQQLEYRWNTSEFLQKYLPRIVTNEKGEQVIGTKFTEARWEFTNLEGHKFCVRGFGATTGVRGFKEYGKRPVWLGMDDLLSDKNSDSPTIIKDIRNIVYKAARQAMHPAKRMILWTGTPFNKRDPLYTAAGSKAWNTRVYPICEKYPCTKEDFRGGWEDRFPYEFVQNEYNRLLESGEISAFNQELMLKIVSEEDRLIQDNDIMWYSRDSVMRNRHLFNFYITTDWATSEKDASDPSVTLVWAYSSVGDWFLVEAVVKRQLMDKNIEDVFRLSQFYKPQQVGIEISGQQKGFIPWIKQKMIDRNQWFILASDNNGNQEGIRPVTKKITRFLLVVPWFKAKTMYFPADLKQTLEMQEILEVLVLATMEGFKSKIDDPGDAISQLSSLTPWRPSPEMTLVVNDQEIWGYEEEEVISARESYIV